MMDGDVDVFTVDHYRDDDEQQAAIRAELDKRRGGRFVRSLIITHGRRSVDPRITVDTVRCFVVWDMRGEE